MAAFFGMSQGRANEWIINSVRLGKRAGAAQAYRGQPTEPGTSSALCVSVDFMIDGTERPVQRPTNALEQQDQYSGKKKDTLKNISSLTSKSAWCAT